MKKILLSVLSIAVVGAVAIGASQAFFTDTETSKDNTFTAGTIDIAVDNENPWMTEGWTNLLDKPCETNYMTFTIKNVGENPANIWKRLTNIVNGPGVVSFGGASSEPEYDEGGGEYWSHGAPSGNGYVERDNLSAFMIYDMSICLVTVDNACDTAGDTGNEAPVIDTGWVVLINEADQVRVDNVADTWISLYEELASCAELVVSQSYHLMTWDDSGQPIITNWAQGDTMEFDVELEARQLTAPAPGVTLEDGVERATAELVNKDTTTWDPIGSATGTLTYDIAGDTFNYDFNATGLVANEDYRLIYYPDPWANPKAITLIGDPMFATGGSVDVSNESHEINTDLPDSADANYPAGAKVWLVPSSSLSGSNLLWTDTHKFLFDLTMVNYEDTN